MYQKLLHKLLIPKDEFLKMNFASNSKGVALKESNSVGWAAYTLSKGASR